MVEVSSAEIRDASQLSSRPTEGKRRTYHIAAWLFFAALVAFYAMIFGSAASDDAYITYRYSANLINHGEPTWNIGEDPVEGYTSQLWMLWNALSVLLGVHPLIWSRALSIIALAVLYWTILRRSEGVPALFRTGLLAVCVGSPILWFFAFSGMEATVFFVVVALLVERVLFGGGASRSTGELLAVSLLTAAVMLIRPEGWAIAGVLCCLVIYRARIGEGGNDTSALPPRWIVIPTAVIATVVLLFRMFYYGYPLANTYYAKHGSISAARLLNGLEYVATSVSTIALLAVVSLVLVVAAHVFVGPVAASTKPSLGLAAAIVVILLYAIWVGGDDTAAFGFGRLIMPASSLLVVITMRVSPALLRNLPAIEGTKTLRSGRTGMAVALLVVAAWYPVSWFTASPPLTPSFKEAVRVTQDQASTPFEKTDMSTWIDDEFGTTITIAIPWAGRLAYEHLGGHVIDTLGLNNEHIAHNAEYEPTGPSDRMAPHYVLSQRPDLVFVNVDRRYVEGEMTFEEAGGWKRGDRVMIQLLQDSPDYHFVGDAPGTATIFARQQG